MHPFYGPSERLLRGADARGAGLVSMAAYLGFWAVAAISALAAGVSGYALWRRNMF